MKESLWAPINSRTELTSQIKSSVRETMREVLSPTTPQWFKMSKLIDLDSHRSLLVLKPLIDNLKLAHQKSLSKIY